VSAREQEEARRRLVSELPEGWLALFGGESLSHPVVLDADDGPEEVEEEFTKATCWLPTLGDLLSPNEYSNAEKIIGGLPNTTTGLHVFIFARFHHAGDVSTRLN
jgi:hypothetical protein